MYKRTLLLKLWAIGVYAQFISAAAITCWLFTSVVFDTLETSYFSSMLNLADVIYWNLFMIVVIFCYVINVLLLITQSKYQQKFGTCVSILLCAFFGSVSASLAETPFNTLPGYYVNCLICLSSIFSVTLSVINPPRIYDNV